jgi:mannitol/fructose-specific phosphotransferase system IIA component (Ntr-type)
LIERVTGEKSTGYMVDEELREIIIDRDDVTERRFEQVIKNCEILDVFKYMRPDKFAWVIANKLAKKLGTNKEKLHKLLKKREEDSNVVIHPGIAIFSHIIKGRDKFEIILVRSKKGMIISDDADPIHAFFVIVASPDQKSFYLHALMWIIQIAEETDFENEWVNAKNVKELRDILLKSWGKRKSL